MTILGLETSCDETAAAVVQDGMKVLSSVIATSSDMHIKTGGIIPENAARRQIESIIPVIQKALKDSFPKTSSLESQIRHIDAIAVTYGPGLIGSLLVGAETAKTLSCIWDKPLIPVNHLVAHIYANWIDTKPPTLPAIALVVSGGHTDMVLMKGHGKLKWIGGTRDDAAGECFDKCARLLELPYPGGPSISKEADNFFQSPKSEVQNLNMFPRPMMHTKDFDFSFSGLKTSVYNYLQTEHKKVSRDKLAAEIQEAIADVLVKKSIDALKLINPKSFLLSGGVAANVRLREKLQLEVAKLEKKVDLRIPSPKYCTDNGVVIGSCAYFNKIITPWQKISADPQLEIV
ncbi:tRNA (adenosine(37)-N6)-threonylcarbamoyltransferase complex transferase subunit TsaD [Patescibacteria group bacterium]